MSVLPFGGVEAVGLRPGRGGRLVTVPPGRVPDGVQVVALVVLVPDGVRGGVARQGGGRTPAQRPALSAPATPRTISAPPPGPPSVPQPGPPPGPAKRIGPGLLLDLEGRLVSADGEALDLTRREFDLLAHLSTRPGRVLTRAQLLTAVWGLADARHAGPRTVDVHVARLRRKLGVRHGAPLSTLRGVGYRWSAGSRVTGE